jgi:hypothetical protein
MTTIRKSLSLLLVLAASKAGAFPPAPCYTLHGIVRDQTGQVVRAESASVILFKGTAEAGRASIGPLAEPDKNYELRVRIDQARPATTLYNASAVPSEGQFGLKVELGGRLYYPIEVTGTLTAGKGGESVKLDLTLGEDSDRDGLPDAWEQWQLFQAGKLPGEDGQRLINLLDKDGDFDGDGQSNYMEYLAGTFAGDATEFFKLEIKEKLAEKIRFEFYGITGKTYTIERSTDNRTWTRLPLSTGTAEAQAADTYTATAVGVQSAFVTPAAGAASEFFRLTAR